MRNLQFALNDISTPNPDLSLRFKIEMSQDYCNNRAIILFDGRILYSFIIASAMDIVLDIESDQGTNFY